MKHLVEVGSRIIGQSTTLSSMRRLFKVCFQSVRLLTVLVCGVAVFVAGKSYSADTAVIVGGGYKLAGSQGQIEKNVKWVQDVLKQAGVSVHTYFTDGTDPGVDVHVIDSATDTRPDLEALARVFGDIEGALTRRHSNTVADNLGSTEAGELLPALSTLLSDSEGVPLLVFNGHGGPSPDGRDEVTLKLWEETAVSARELHDLLDKDSTDLRYVFTQCYSGGFHRLAYEDSESGLELADATRCGFTAESAWRLAERCSASIDSADYRDYTTFFFAALSGKTRNNEVLSDVRDVDADGEISLRDAHLYTLEHAHSTDLSRSTSEDFLDQWLPWLDRWLPASASLPENEYTELSRRLASRLGFEKTVPDGKEIREVLQEREQRHQQLQSEASVIHREVRSIARALQKQVFERWPQASSPYTRGFVSLAESGELQVIDEWLEQQSQYTGLRDRQLRLHELSDLTLQAERDAIQVRKLLRLRRLARIKGSLYAKGSEQHIESYERLVACENLPLNTTGFKEVDPLQQVLNSSD